MSLRAKTMARSSQSVSSDWLWGIHSGVIFSQCIMHRMDSLWGTLFSGSRQITHLSIDHFSFTQRDWPAPQMIHYDYKMWSCSLISNWFFFSMNQWMSTVPHYGHFHLFAVLWCHAISYCENNWLEVLIQHLYPPLSKSKNITQWVVNGPFTVSVVLLYITLIYWYLC